MEEFRLKSSLIPNTEFMSTMIGKGAPDTVAEDGLKFGVNWQTVLLAHEPIAAPEWFTIVNWAFPKVNLMLAYVSGGTFARLRNAVSVCKCPNSTSTGTDSTGTAGLLESDGCRLAPVMEASKKRTATPFGGVSPIVRLIGTPLVGVLEFMEPPQAARKALLRSASAKREFRLIENPPVVVPIWEHLKLGTRGRTSSFVRGMPDHSNELPRSSRKSKANCDHDLLWACFAISARGLFQLQSPGCKRHAASPLALLAQQPNGGSEVCE